jgi:NADH dehydrogenase (ubiquinone) Fe-S protein 3
MLKTNSIVKFQKLLPFILFQEINKETILVLSKTNFLFVLFLLKNHIYFQYKILSCISGVDLIGKKYRFCIAYDLLSVTFNSRLRIKVFVDEIATIPTLVNIYINSN